MDRLRDYSLLRLTTAASASNATGGLPRVAHAAPAQAERLQQARDDRARFRRPDAPTGATGLHVLPLSLGNDPRGRSVILPCAIADRHGAGTEPGLRTGAGHAADEDGT